MSNEPIVHKQPIQTAAVNPFSRAQSEHVSAGAVAIESERAIAEAQGKLVIAKRFPRDQARAYANIMEACKRPGLAEEACYTFPRGGQNISGPSIRLAEMLAANWGNIDYGIRELSRKEGVSEMEAYAWDLETNTHSSQKFTVRHIRDTRTGGVALKDERDIYELTANMGGRRLRARILAIIPADIIQAAVTECTKTIEGGNDLPLADRVRNMVTAFKSLGVTPALVEKRLRHSLESVTPAELGELRQIHNSLRDGVSKWADWFGDAPDGSNPDLEAALSRPAPPPRAAKGAAAVKENAGKEVIAEVEPVQFQPEIITYTKEESKTAAEVVAALTAPLTAPEVQPQVPVTAPKPEKVEATPVPAAPVPAAPPEPAADTKIRLNPGEKMTAIVDVTVLKPMRMQGTNKATGAVESVPVVYAEVTGDYTGPLVHPEGAALEGDAVVAVAPWKVGAHLHLELVGGKSPKAIVEKAEVEEVF